MIEALTSLIHNYKSKIRNPFFGTLASVWLFRNWIVVYALFNFDKAYKMHYRIKYIQQYFSKKDFWAEFWINILVTFSVLLITYILFAFSRFLTDLYYKICEPRIITLIDQKAIFTSADKAKLDNRITLLNTKIERQNDAILRHESTNQILNTKNSDLELEIKNKLLEHGDTLHNQMVKYETLESKTIPSNKVINYFDDIINGFSESIKNEIKVFIEHSDNITSNEYQNFVGLKAELQKIGVLINVNGKLKKSILGILFLEYYRSLKENDLPF